MRILLGLESYLPNISGVVVFTKRLATFLAGQGHRVRILTTSPFGWPYEEKDPADFYIFRLKGWRNPFRKDLRVSYPWNRKEVRRLLEEFSPDIVHTQDIAFLCQIIRREATAKKIPIIAHHHFSMGFALSYVKPAFLRPPVRVLILHRGHHFYNRCNLVITPTEFVKRELLAWGVKTPILAISNGVDLKRFRPGKPEKEFCDRFGIHPREKVITYVGRLDKDKNILTLIRAIPEVLKKLPEAKFIFVGEGTERKNLQARVKRFPWAKSVHFVGFIAQEDPALPKLYQLSDVVWTASAIETQSITTLEGMASGLPVVAANAGALPELVHENDNGFLVNPFNSRGFAEAAVQILKNKELAKKFSERSREIAQGHAIEESFSKIFAAYRRVIGEEEHPV